MKKFYLSFDGNVTIECNTDKDEDILKIFREKFSEILDDYVVYDIEEIEEN